MEEQAKRVCPMETRDIVDKIVQFIEAFRAVCPSVMTREAYGLYTYQSLFARRIIESVLDQDGATITGLWARQSGKTECVAVVAVGMALLLPALAEAFPDDPRLSPFAGGFYVGIYAPVQEQAEISFSRMRETVNSDQAVQFMGDPELNVEVVTNRGNTLTFSNGSYILARTASPDSQIEGKTFHLIILEECQKILRTKVDKEISPMLVATNGTMVKIGTAWESRGGFHTSIQLNVDEHKKGGKRNHFEFPYDIVIAEKRRAFERDGKHFHLNYEKKVLKDKQEMGGESSIEFRMNYMCLWNESRVIAVRAEIFSSPRVALADLERGLRRGRMQVAGLDIGKINDPTVLTIMDVDWDHPYVNPFKLAESDEDKQNYYMKTILDWLELSGSFEGHTGQYQQLVEYLEHTSVEVLVIDSTAMGDPVYERIEAMIGGMIMCVPYRFTGLTKSHLYKYYLSELHAGRIRYPAGPDTRTCFEYRKFQTEHLDLDKVEFGGYAVCQAPDGGHDDYPDSAALAAWGEKIAEDVIMPFIQVSAAPFGGRRSGGDESRRGDKFMGQAVRERSGESAHPGRGSRYSRRG